MSSAWHWSSFPSITPQPSGILASTYGRPARWAYDNPKAWRIGWLESRDGGRTFTARQPVQHDPNSTTWRPRLEHATGFNEVPYPASFVYAGGDVTFRNSKTVDSPVYYVEVNK